MPKSHPPYAPAFRHQMVELVRSGRTPEELSREFDPAAQAIWNWVRQSDRDEGRSAHGPSSAERACAVRTGSCARSATSWQRRLPGSLGRPT
jgi:transposase